MGERPVPSASPTGERPVPSREEAPGPLVLYEDRTSSGEARLMAVDVSAQPRSPIFLATTAADPSAETSFTQQSSSAVAVHAAEGRVAVAARGRRASEVLVATEGWVRSAAISPDARHFAVASNTEDQAGLISIHRLDAKEAQPRRVRLGTSSDMSGGDLELFWSDAGSLLAVDVCHCDGGPGYSRALAIEPDGRVRELSLLDERDHGSLGAQVGGRSLVFDQTPLVDCFESEHACDNLEHTLTILDLQPRTMRAIARRHRVAYGVPQISPAGTRIAATAAPNTIEIFDTASGRTTATIPYDTGQLDPAGWIDEERLVALATSPDPAGERHAGRLVTIDARNPGTAPTPLATGIDLRYVGWLR